MLARRCYASIKYKGIDITEDISNEVLGFSFKDNMDKADGMELTLVDPTGKWMNDWFPEEGDFIDAEVHTINWRHDGDKQRLYCGRFIIDTPSFSGPADQLTLNGTSIPKNTGITDPKNRTYERITFKALTKMIADLYGYELLYLVEENPMFEYLIQENESDLSLLSRQCKKRGYYLKVSGNRIVIAEDKLMMGNPVLTIEKDSAWLDNYNFSVSLVSKYKECSVSYYDTIGGKTLTYVHALDEEADKVYHIKKRANSYEEAVGICKAISKKITRSKYTCQFELVGNVEVLAGVTVMVKSFGKFDGEYLLTSADHQLDSAYSTSVVGYRVEASHG